MDFLIDPYRWTAVVQLTSQLYPPVFVDGVDLGADLIGGQLNAWLPENLDITTEFSAGAMPIVASYATYDLFEQDAVNTTADFLDAVLIEVVGATVIDYAIDPEAADFEAEFVTGSIEVILIRYTDWPAEGANITADFASGAFT
jgi:hypothetical protein